jgi:hypothetical protein
MDIIAPGDPEIVHSTSAEDADEYDDFSDTSAALPHAGGVAGMIAMKHPTNLDQEDIEQLLQISASDEGNLGYDSLNAWGRVNAQRALEMIDENHDQLQVLHYTIQGEFPKITQDASPVALELDFGFEDFCSKEYGTITGKRRKYYYDFSIDLGTLGATLATLPDTNLKPYWIRNAQSGLWGAPDGNDIRPENGTYFEGLVSYDSLTGVLSGRVAGWTIVDASTASGACADPNNPCSGQEIPTCYFGQPPVFPLSILVETPTVINSIWVTDPDDPNLLYVNRKDHRYGPEGYIRFRETINLLDINTLEEKEIQFFE